MLKTFCLGLLFALSAQGLALSAKADDGSSDARTRCREESLIRFVAKGQTVGSELIGAADPCDDFGGNLVRSPGAGLSLFVNFNIPGTIDLDALDAAFEANANQAYRDDLRSVSLAVVSREWMIRQKGGDHDAILNWTRDTLFISEKVLSEDRFSRLVEEFYGAL